MNTKALMYGSSVMLGTLGIAFIAYCYSDLLFSSHEKKIEPAPSPVAVSPARPDADSDANAMYSDLEQRLKAVRQQ